MKYLNSIILLCTSVILFECATVPVTGRRQLSLVSNSEIIPMSFEQYGAVLKTSKLSTDKQQTAMVKNVGNRIETAVEQYM